MRKWWIGLASLVAALLALVGCSTTDQNISKPPPAPPDYVLPPADEAKYSKPPDFPEKTLNERKKKSDPMMPPNGIRSPRSGGMGGMGGY